MIGLPGTEVVVGAVGVSAVIGAGYSIHRAARSIRAWAKRMIDIATHGFSEAVDSSSTGSLVTYHLGPNGTTTPLHERVTETQDYALARHDENLVKFELINDRLDQLGAPPARPDIARRRAHRQGDTST